MKRVAVRAAAVALMLGAALSSARPPDEAPGARAPVEIEAPPIGTDDELTVTPLAGKLFHGGSLAESRKKMLAPRAL